MDKCYYFRSLFPVKLIYCAGFIIFFSLCVNAQDMAIRVYGSKDGLPSTYVFGSYEDKLGYIWVGSTDGLSRFDGKYFTNYGVSEGLPDTRTIAEYMDNHYRLWVGTARGVVELKGDRFINYPLSDSQNIHWVFGILETRQGEILSLTNTGVYRFNLNKWWKIKLYPGYENHVCRDIIETKEGVYINYGDLVVLMKPDNTYKIIGRLKKDGTYYLKMLRSGEEIFVSTIEGIYKLANQQLVKLLGVLGRLNSIYNFYMDRQKRAWIGKDKSIGLVAIAHAGNFTPVYQHPVSMVVQSITEDKQGNIWVSSGIGLIRVSDKGFKVFKMPASWAKKPLRNVLQPPRGPLLISNGSSTLQRFENEVFKKTVLHKKTSTPLPNNELIIDNYAFDDKNRYWYCLRNGALGMQQGDHIYVQTPQLDHVRHEVLYVLFDKYRKKILVAVSSQKFPWQFNGTGYSLLTMRNNIDIKGNIGRLHQCANGSILFTTDQGRVYSIDKQNYCKQQLNEFKADGAISWFYNDPSGDVWIIYNGRGLRHYFWQHDSLVFKEQITQADGLPSDNISSLCFDNANYLWVCSNSNLVIFSNFVNKANKQAHQIVGIFDEQDLPLENSHGLRITKDSKGNIWLFADKQLMCFYPDKVNYSNPIPGIEIEKIELNLRQTNWRHYADSLQGIFQLPVNLQLSHENNTLGIYFKGISSSGTNGIKYSYLLEGVQNQWSNPANTDFVSFVKLPPGEYSFKVKAQLLNANWSQPVVFSFVIHRAFWQTWWFYSLIGMIVMATIYLLFRYRLRQKINVLEMRNRISQDLHDEIGASISGINLLSQMAAEKLNNNNTSEASEYLFKVKNYSQEVIEKLSDMVWVFNPQNDSIEKLLQRLRSFAISIALSKNIKIHFVTDKEAEMMNLTIRQRKAIYLLSKEAINNIFKYAECGNIFYSLHPKGSKWQLLIQDDGKGFYPAENGEGNGLKNMQARAIEIGGQFNIRSQPGNGTVITLDF
jgi:ligand-binding sensor domain-containing protein